MHFTHVYICIHIMRGKGPTREPSLICTPPALNSYNTVTLTMGSVIFKQVSNFIKIWHLHYQKCNTTTASWVTDLSALC